MSFSSSLKKASLASIFLLLASCQNLRTRENLRPTPPPSRGSVTAPSPVVSPTAPAIEPEAPAADLPQVPGLPPAPVIPSIPKIGIILGAGGAKTFAHIGFLHELMRAKVPVHSIGGIEFAAPMAALYANKEQANDVEWQMFKLKEDEITKKTLLGAVSKNNDVTILKDFTGNAFNRSKVEDFRLQFACPSYNLKKNQVYLMNRGGLDQLMYLCMAYPPFFQPYQGSVSGVREVTAMANYLRSKGANYIVLVNVLQAPGVGKAFTSDANGTDNVLWSEIAGLYNKPFAGVDTIISLETGSYGIMDFDKRREIMSKGAESAARQLKNLTRKWGL